MRLILLFFLVPCQTKSHRHPGYLLTQLSPPTKLVPFHELPHAERGPFLLPLSFFLDCSVWPSSKMRFYAKFIVTNWWVMTELGLITQTLSQSSAEGFFKSALKAAPLIMWIPSMDRSRCRCWSMYCTDMWIFCPNAIKCHAQCHWSRHLDWQIETAVPLNVRYF